MAESAPSAGADAPQLKTCSKCNAAKPKSEFTADRQKADGLASACRECRSAYGKRWYAGAKNGSRKAAIQRRHAEILANQKLYRLANPEKFRELARRWVATNQSKHRESVKEAQRRYRSTPHGKAAIRRRQAEPKIRLERNISRGVHRGLVDGKSGRRTFDMLDFTPEQLRAHLERQFLPGMTWENYGPVWHVDHKVPLSAHNYSTPDHADFKRAWALSNLQPLWASDNRVKSKKLAGPFQPSLQI